MISFILGLFFGLVHKKEIVHRGKEFNDEIYIVIPYYGEIHIEKWRKVIGPYYKYRGCVDHVLIKWLYSRRNG